MQFVTFFMNQVNFSKIEELSEKHSQEVQAIVSDLVKIQCEPAENEQVYSMQRGDDFYVSEEVFKEPTALNTEKRKYPIGDCEYDIWTSENKK